MRLRKMEGFERCGCFKNMSLRFASHGQYGVGPWKELEMFRKCRVLIQFKTR